MNNHDNRNLNEVLINATIIFLLILVSIVIVALPASADSCTGKYKLRDSRGVVTQTVRVYSNNQGQTTRVNTYNNRGQRTGSYRKSR